MLKLNTFEIKNLSQPTQTLLVVWSAAEIENFLNKLLLCIKELDELLVCLSAIFPSENKTMDLKLIYKYKHLPFNIFFQIAAFSRNGLYIRNCCYLKKYIKWSMYIYMCVCVGACVCVCVYFLFSSRCLFLMRKEKVAKGITWSCYCFIVNSSRIRTGEKKTYKAQVDTQLISNILKQVCIVE